MNEIPKIKHRSIICINFSIPGQYFYFTLYENTRKPFEDFFAITNVCVYSTEVSKSLLKKHEKIYKSFKEESFVSETSSMKEPSIFGFDNGRIRETRKSAELTIASGISSQFLVDFIYFSALH